MFNALKYTQELEKAGFSREQAEATLRLLIDVMNDNFATKSDLKETELTLRSEMKELRANLKEVEYRMTIKVGAMMTVAVGILATLIRMRAN